MTSSQLSPEVWENETTQWLDNAAEVKGSLDSVRG